MISIIIPVYNEEAVIEKLLLHLKKYADNNLKEIIVADGGSTDNTSSVVLRNAVKFINCKIKSRAVQMNEGTAISTGNILYFIHADTLPPKTFSKDIIGAVNDGFGFGRFCLKLQSNDPRLLVNSFFSRFDWFACYGGDQTFFITKKLFAAIGGFNNSMLIMEDYDITERARKKGRYKIIKKPVVASARKYENNSWLTIQQANYKLVSMYKKGCDQQLMADTYKKILHVK